MLSTAQKLIYGFLTLIVGISLLGAIATQMNSNTAYSVRTDTLDLSPARLAGGAINETYAFSLSSTYISDGWRIDYDECNAEGLIKSTLITMKNSSQGVLDMNGCGSNGDWVVVEGINSITFCNSAPVNNSLSNTTTATYSYCSNEYVAQSWGKTVLKTTLGLFAVALLLIAVGLFYSSAKDSGLMR